MSALRTAILRTLVYADIFDFPLSIEELWERLIAKKPTVFEDVRKEVESLRKEKIISGIHGWYFLRGREKLVELRRERNRFSQLKFRKAKAIGRCLKFVPGLRALAVTGTIAVGNAQETDDIDLMCLCARGRLWLTRLILVPLISLVATRRKPDREKKATHQDELCLNLWLDEGAFAVPTGARNLYTAHEVVQTRLLWDKNGFYQKFLAANRWVRHYLPNADIPKVPPIVKIQKTKYQILDTFEKFAFQFQLAYMRSKMTKEKVDPYRAFFHPQNMSHAVLEAYRARLTREPLA